MKRRCNACGLYYPPYYFRVGKQLIKRCAPCRRARRQQSDAALRGRTGQGSPWR